MIRTTNTKSYNMVKYPTVFQTGCAERTFIYLGLVKLFYIGSGYFVGKPQPFGPHVGIFSRSFSMIVIASRLLSHFVWIVFTPILKRLLRVFLYYHLAIVYVVHGFFGGYFHGNAHFSDDQKRVLFLL